MTPTEADDPSKMIRMIITRNGEHLSKYASAARTIADQKKYRHTMKLDRLQAD